MTTNNIYSAHDEDGRIYMSNKIYDTTSGDYGKVLADRDIKYVAHSGNGPANLDQHFVWKGRIADMPKMRVNLNKQRFKAGEQDAIKLRGIPEGAVVEVHAMGYAEALWVHTENTGSAEISVPSPGAYIITITKFPYRQWQMPVSATND